MKDLVKMSRACGYLEKMYRQLNTDFFNGELETPIITIQSTPTAYGHVTVGKVWKNSKVESQQYELNIGAGTLNRPIESVVSTLMHEMVHIYNLMHEIKDTSRGGTYHNKKFKEKAESVGLVIDHDQRIGYSITSPSESLIDYIIQQQWEDILINRQEGIRINVPPSGKSPVSGSSEGTEKKPSSTRKYQCPCCGLSVRATKVVRVKCINCDKELELCSK